MEGSWRIRSGTSGLGCVGRHIFSGSFGRRCLVVIRFSKLRNLL